MEGGFYTLSGIPIKRIYTPDDIQDLVYESDLNDAGSYPFTRGIHPNMYRERYWIMRVLCGESTPNETNRRLKLLSSAGQTGIDVIGDAPTVAFVDSDHPLAAKSVGTQGVPLCCLQDYQEMLDGIPLDKITLSWSVPHCFAIAGLATIAQKNKVSLDSIRGSTVIYPLYCEDCSYASRQPLDMRLRLAVDSIEFCARHMPNYHSFVEDVYYISEVGLDSIEEIALGLIEARLIITEVLKRGLSIDDFAHRIVLLVTARMDFFEEIAKYRALRRIWARMMREEYKAENPRSWRAVITVHTSGLSLTSKQLVNNIIRGAYEALAAVLGGCQAIEISCFDEPYRTPSADAATIALRTQQLIAYESGVAAVADPLGGSYFVEALTNEMERRIWDLVKEIENKGSAYELSQKGYFTALFDKAIKRYYEAVKSGHRKVVGVNIFTVPPEKDTLLRGMAETKIRVAEEQIQKIKELRVNRNRAEVKEVLEEVCHKAQDKKANLIPMIMEAFKRNATMGEITGAIRLAYDATFDPFEMVTAPI